MWATKPWRLRSHQIRVIYIIDTFLQNNSRGERLLKQIAIWWNIKLYKIVTFNLELFIMTVIFMFIYYCILNRENLWRFFLEIEFMWNFVVWNRIRFFEKNQFLGKIGSAIFRFSSNQIGIFLWKFCSFSRIIFKWEKL